MATFKVSDVIDGDTFEVQGGWSWNNRTGTRVRPTGYDTPEKHQPGHAIMTQKLASLILGKDVELTNCATIDQWGRLVCEVRIGGRNLADHFRQYKT